MTRTRTLAALALSFALTSGLASNHARAANEPPPPPGAEGEGEGRTLDGYFLGGLLGGLVFFLVCKSARRS
jgi:hypothetical protein